MAREGWSSTLLRKDLHPPGQSTLAWHHQISPWLSSSWTPQMMETNRTGHAWLLVAKDGPLFNRLCERLWPLQLHENLSSVPHQKAHAQPNHWLSLASHLGWSETELPLSQGYDAIMVVVDHLSKQAHVKPTTSDITATGVAWLFWDHIWKLHGLLEEVISVQEHNLYWTSTDIWVSFWGSK